MAIWIALLRGINVGGHHKLPMTDLAAIVEAAGGRNVRTYIQSGNVVFDADIDDFAAFTDKIGAKNRGFAWLLPRHPAADGHRVG